MVKTQQKETAIDQIIGLVERWQHDHAYRKGEVRISREEMAIFRELDGKIAGLAARLGLEIPKHRGLSQGSRRQLIGFTQLRACWDFDAWLACHREWLERIQGLVAALEAALLAQPEAADDEDKRAARLLALADKNQIRIIAIADNPELTVDEKLRAIAEIDRRFFGKTGDELGQLVNSSGAAVRQTEWWKVDKEEYSAARTADSLRRGCG